MEVKIDLAATIERVRKAAELELVNNTNRVTRSVVLDLLNSGSYGDKEDLAHEIIRKKVEGFILSDTYTKLIDEVIEQNMREEAASAVKTLLNSKIRKSLFQPTSPIESERDLSEWVIVMDGSPDKLVWGDALGWVAFEDSHLYNRYTADQKNDVLLPMGGIWYRIPERKLAMDKYTTVNIDSNVVRSFYHYKHDGLIVVDFTDGTALYIKGHVEVVSEHGEVLESLSTDDILENNKN